MTPRDVGELALGHALQHEQIEADRRRDLRHLDHQRDEDTKPDQVERPRDRGQDNPIVSTTIEMPSRKQPRMM